MSSSGTNVAEYLLSTKDPARIALQFSHSPVSYGTLADHAGRIATYLLDSCGAKKGDRVLLIADNSPFWVACYLGAIQAGLVIVPIAANTPVKDLAYLLDITDAKIVCAQSSVVRTNPSIFDGKHLITDNPSSPAEEILSQQNFPAICTGGLPHQRYSPVEPTDLAALVFTSGSTGQPRGVMISHHNIIANTESIISYLSLTEQDRIMAVLPFHYCYGASLLHTHLRIGGEMVVENRFMYPEVVLQRMIETKCTGFAGVPSHFQILVRNSSIRRKQFPSLRYVQQAGGHLAPAFIRELKVALPDTQIFVMYGQTEATARLSYLPPDRLSDKLGSIGKGMPGVILRVLNDAGKDVKPGEVGEIVAEGKNIAQGYWRTPPDSKEVFRQGVLHTGDLARVDEEGYIYIVDRAKDFIKCRGEKVSCRQLEETLLEFDELIEAAVIGVSDEILGEAAKAFVVPRTRDAEGLTGRVFAFCRGRLPPHHLPKEIVILPSLPKNSSGKIMKATLRGQ